MKRKKIESVQFGRIVYTFENDVVQFVSKVGTFIRQRNDLGFLAVNQPPLNYFHSRLYELTH